MGLAEFRKSHFLFLGYTNYLSDTSREVTGFPTLTSIVITFLGSRLTTHPR
jgi:hypothetical protein